MTAPERAPRPAGTGVTPPSEDAQTARKCPVCGESMDGRDPYGHSLVHFPDAPIPVRNDTLMARKQQAELLGRDIPEE